jgi:hypothetical protein
LRRYKSRWDNWCDFAALHRVRVSALPPDEYIMERAEVTASMSAVNASVFAINHFRVRNKFVLPLHLPYYALVLRGISHKLKKSSVPREPFTRVHIRSFLDCARATDDLRVWRGVFPHVTCFQQLMRGEEAYNLTGANVEESAGVLKLVGVKAKNHRLGYT